MLKEELEQHDLWQLAQEDFRLACHPNGSKPRYSVPAWTRFSTRRELTPRDLTVLESLLAWRDQTAADLDRPPFKVLDDDRLVEIASAKPSTPGDLAEIGLTARQLQNWNVPILMAVEQGMKKAPVKPFQRPHPGDAYLKRLEKLKNWRKKAAAKMDVESDVVLPRPFLLALAEKGPQDVRSVLRASPWRLEHFGDDILKVLGG
jgi:ribonuclease D